MKDFFKTLFAISAAVISISATIIVIYTYWDRIKNACGTTARFASNVANAFNGDGLEKAEDE
ncbi:MAG: hypothetical protein LBN34_04045 [Clostridiales Family XIII bacterium]|jgi:hypothetical protein|nr:hypothetical protein [Clostridiales Family XIII bacterium]